MKERGKQHRQIKAFVRADERAQRLASINGIGPITASAIVATVGNAREFKNGRLGYAATVAVFVDAVDPVITSVYSPLVSAPRARPVPAPS